MRGARGVREVAAGLAEGAAELLWPTRCFGCDAPGTLLCPACRAALPAIDQRRACRRCGAPFGSLVCTECTDCLARDDEEDRGERAPLENALDALDAVCCYGVHAWPLDRAVRGYKDGGERRAAGLLAALLVQAVEDAYGARGRWDGVAFVPCTPGAFARRGRDHMEAVGRAAAEALGVPLVDVLARDDARDQRGLTREQRAANARRSFVAVSSLEGARLLLLDDVLTTGATLGAAAGALRAVGAATVEAATVARAW